MGANIVNTVAENTAPFIIELLGQGRAALKILTNLCTGRLVMSEFSIPTDAMHWKGTPGSKVARRIVEAQRFAELDQYRATTHNKGIMNGIDGVALALGQDWRAVEAAAHSYASIGGSYQPLTKYWVTEATKEEPELLHGRIEMPISVGTKGGAIETNPSYRNTHNILGFPSASETAQIMVSVGLS